MISRLILFPTSFFFFSMFTTFIFWLELKNNINSFVGFTFILIITLLCVITYLFYKTASNEINILSNHNKTKKVNKNLKKRIKRGIKELREKDKIIMQQSRAAAMGEMIDAIAHQWKTPVSIVRLYLDELLINLEENIDMENEHIIEYLKKAENQITHITQTLDEFRGFFRPAELNNEVSLKDVLESCMLLLKDELIRNKISTNIRCEIDYEPIVDIIANEFKHVIINLISNSKDAFEENKIKDRNIDFVIQEDSKKNLILKVIDNAGGIPEDIIDKIFQSNFTTKSKEKGTGIGLYMCKQILNKNSISVKVENYDKGVCFLLKFDKANLVQ